MGFAFETTLNLLGDFGMCQAWDPAAGNDQERVSGAICTLLIELLRSHIRRLSEPEHRCKVPARLDLLIVLFNDESS